MNCLRLMVFVLLLTVSQGFSQGWEKYEAPDGSFSLVYPEGWTVSQNESIIEITDSGKDEQLLVVAIPFDSSKTPRQLAEGMISIFRSAMPDLSPSAWRTTPETKEAAVEFRARYTNEGKSYDANVIVVKDSKSKQALWFSFSGPLAGYDAARAVKLLRTVVGSVASASPEASTQAGPIRTPQSPGRDDHTLDRNAKAFLFVLEFSLGAPFTANQEKIVLAELLSGWRNSPAEELSKFDQYPVLVQAILKAGQADLEDLRRELENSVRQWIEEFRGKSESVDIIETELKRRGRVLSDGQPPLTEMAAVAYSEIMAFSELIHRDTAAPIEQIPDRDVQEIRRQLQSAWAGLSQVDRDLIATSPGLWFCLRTLLRHGSKSEQEKTRESIQRLTVKSASQGRGSGQGRQSSDMTRTLTERMVTHNIIMEMQKTTFNSYMWSRGFNYHPVYGKMW
jgi:hypothetical protein